MNLQAYEVDDCRLICVDMYTCTYIRSGDDVKTERVLREYLDRHKEGERGEGAVAVMFTSTIKALSQVLLNVYRQRHLNVYRQRHVFIYQANFQCRLCV